MKVECKIEESTLDMHTDKFLIVESDMWPAKDVILKFEGNSIKVNADALKKAVDNCLNI